MGGKRKFSTDKIYSLGVALVPTTGMADNETGF